MTLEAENNQPKAEIQEVKRELLSVGHELDQLKKLAEGIKSTIGIHRYVKDLFYFHPIKLLHQYGEKLGFLQIQKSLYSCML